MPSSLRFSADLLGVLVLPEGNELRVPQVIIRRPLHELKLAQEHRLEPQCRMPDYAAQGAASVVNIAFSGDFVRHNQTEYASTESCRTCSRQ